MKKNENFTKITLADGKVMVAVIDDLVTLQQLVNEIKGQLIAQGLYTPPS